MKKIIAIAGSIYVCLISSGCSSSPDEMAAIKATSSERVIDKSSMENIDQHIAQWQKMKPSLERLILIEGELKTLIHEISKMAAEQKSSTTAKKTQTPSPAITPVPVPVPVPAPLPEPETLKSDVIKNKAKPSYSKYALQIFTVKSTSDLENAWQIWLKKQAQSFTEHEHIYQETQNDTVTYYRVKITNFITKEAAISTCKEIKNQGNDCFLTNNTGQRF